MSSQPPAALSRLLTYLKPHRLQYSLAILFSSLNKLFDIAPEVLIGVAVNVVVKQQDSWLATLGFSSVKEQLIILGLLTLFIWLFESLFQYLQTLSWRNLAQNVQHDMRIETYSHVQDLDMATFEEQSTGNLLSIMNDDINQLERFFEDSSNQIIQTIVSSVVISAIFFILAPQIAWVAVLPVPLILIGAFYFQHRLGPHFLRVREKAGLIGARLSNNITGIFTIKSFATQDYEREQVTADSEAYRQANSKAIALSALVTPVIRIAVLMGFLATLMLGGFLTINGKMDVGVFSILVFLTQRLLWPLTRLADITVLFQRAMASATRILNLLALPIKVCSSGDPLPAQQVKGNIEFNNLSFSYENSPPLFNKLSFTIPAGKTVAFVGTTGSGKTTLIKLLLHFYLPQSGKILLDGKNISEIDQQDLRRSIGIVSQDVFLFQGTVAENIAYASPHISRDKIIDASKMAEAHNFISQLTNGYDTLIGERGQKLSGGQRQRLAIARAILKNPPILILDEATSAVDNETEFAIQKSLEKIVVGRTTIMIAHRLSTVRNADHIFVLKHGEIIEQGTHNSLNALDGVYAELWRLQTGQHL